jgi:hypothetical protein
VDFAMHLILNISLYSGKLSNEIGIIGDDMSAWGQVFRPLRDYASGNRFYSTSGNKIANKEGKGVYTLK